MPRDKNAVKLRAVRHIRLRKKVTGGPQRPRLCVFRSLRHIYAQVIDDTAGNTLAAASSQETASDRGAGQTAKISVAAAVGKLVAERAQAKGINQVVFDRGGYKFHGRVKALAEASREAGLVF
ncbi:MAG: 50S ribosomal protein L18 [SAR202 cluster bacterium Io17-Chloro-G9]|nr:MAG: 50S ribosomal protein L18 [SAR202 cluster bacterium Io17-Chloro-G9]